MLLTYSKLSFVDDIKSGRKKHTFRRDPKNRWRPGMSIQHWFGSPRNTRARNQPFPFDGPPVCLGLQEVCILRKGTENFDGEGPGFDIWVDHQLAGDPISTQIAANDGLTAAEFREWFVPRAKPLWEGRIIHFTDLRY